MIFGLFAETEEDATAKGLEEIKNQITELQDQVKDNFKHMEA